MAGRRSILAAVLVGCICALGASTQQVSRLPESITQAASIDGPAKAEVGKFIDAVDASLTSDDPQAVKSGREMALALLTRQKVSNAFRTSFAALLLPKLLKVVESQNGFTATNAIEVISALQCPDSIAALAELASPSAHPHLATRLSAASALATVRTPIDLQQSQADAILKDISSNFAQETEWMVAAYDLQALQTMSVLAQVPKASQATARSLLVAGVGSLVGRIRKGEADSQLMRAVSRSLAIYLRDQVPQAAPADVAAYVKALEPVLKEIKLLAERPPSGASDPEAFTQAAKIADMMLRNFGGKGRGPGGPKPKPPAR